MRLHFYGKTRVGRLFRQRFWYEILEFFDKFFFQDVKNQVEFFMKKFFLVCGPHLRPWANICRTGSFFTEKVHTNSERFFVSKRLKSRIFHWWTKENLNTKNFSPSGPMNYNKQTNKWAELGHF